MVDRQQNEATVGRRTKTQRLADRLVEGGIDVFVSERRWADQPQSWESIARDLIEATAGVVDVTGATLRNWYGERISA